MISTIKHARLRRFWERDDPRHLPPQLVNRLRSILTALDEAKNPSEVAAPRHVYRSKQSGLWSVRVSKNRCVVFRFENGHAFDVDLVDYD